MSGEFSDEVRGQVYERAMGRCEICGGYPGIEYHHRRPRRAGGSRQADTGTAANCLLLCNAAGTVPAAYTSQRCSKCGQVDPKSRESQAVFRCSTCSYCEHADVNAARNILAAGLAVTACRVSSAPSGVAGTWTQEPAGNRKGLLLRPDHTAPAA